MAGALRRVRYIVCLILMGIVSSCLTACVTPQLMSFETTPEAITVPYRISSSGRFIVDVSVNNQLAQPFSIDTGATVSVIYREHVTSAKLGESQGSVFVRGLVSVGNRPILENVDFQLGRKTFPLGHIVVLETPLINDTAIGLLGADVLAGYTVLFNKRAMTATFVPSVQVPKTAFLGWRRIPLKAGIESKTDARLYFAHTTLKNQKVPILIDTGSNLNFINWQLATMDDDIRKLERRLQNRGTLQGALKTTTIATETVFYDLAIGQQRWDQVDIVVMDLGTLSSVAPVDKPMMVAGANMFSPLTIAFDFDGQSIYIFPKSGP